MIVDIVDCSHVQERTIIVFMWIKFRSLSKIDHSFLEFVNKLSIIVICVVIVFGGEELAEYLTPTIRL